MRLRIRTYRAVEEPDTCDRFVFEHRNVLKDYGITNVTTNNEEWMFNPTVICVIAESMQDNRVVGGLRLQISDENNFLPVEQAIGRMDTKIFDLVKNLRDAGGVAELCALWNAKIVAGKGLSPLIVRAGIAMANQLQVGTLMCICADYTLKMFEKVGFVMHASLGEHGEFPYPNHNYKAKVLGILSTLNFSNADEYERVRMNSLRENPIQHFMEQGLHETIEVDYHLELKNLEKQ